MRPLLYLLSFALMLPGLILALGFILICGIFVRTRSPAASCVALLAAVIGGVVVALGSHPFSEGRWVVLVPGIASLWMSAWLAMQEWRGPASSSVEGLGDPDDDSS